MNESQKNNLSEDLRILLQQIEGLKTDTTLAGGLSTALSAGSLLTPLYDAFSLLQEDILKQQLEAQENKRLLAEAQEKIEQLTGQRSMAEQQLIEAMSMVQTANTTKSEFLANVSHEIRTPMNGIMGLTDLLLTGELQAEQRRYMDMIKCSASRLLTLLNDILDYSKIETGKLEIVPITFNLRDMVANSLEPLKSRAQDKGLSLNIALHADIPDILIGDPGRLRQVLGNLVTNAIKFTEHGSVTVRIAPVVSESHPGVVRFSEDEGLFVLYCQVEDTGIGIPESKKNRIFDAFQQVDGSSTRKYGGVGLGLTIARQIVELMGGSIWVETPAQGGTILHFTVQLRRQIGAALETYLVPLQELKGISLLIAENNHTDRFVMREMMQRWFRTIETVDSSKALMSVIEQQSFDLVLLNKELPDQSGFETARSLRQFSIQPRIILLTSKGQRGDAQLCRETGIEGYLLKPIAHIDLLRAIRTVLARPVCTTSGAELPLITRHYLRETSRQLHVLLAENDYLSQVLSTAQLEGQGWRVSPATSGHEVLNAIEHEEFSFLIIDISLCGMDGFTLVKEIREREKESVRRSVLIGIGSLNREEVILECLAAGFDGYIQRPLSVERVREEAGRLVDGLMAISCLQTEPMLADRTRILDTDRLLASRCPDNLDLARRMVSYLLNEAGPGWLKNLERAIAAGDVEGVRDVCHLMGNTAESLFATELSGASSQLFQAATEGALATKGPADFEALRDAFLRVKTLGEQFLAA